MKQIWPNYSYSPTTNVLTLTELNIDRDQLLLVTAADRGRIMYNFADSSVTASAFTSGANTALTLVATTAGLTTTAALVIYYDDQLAGTTVSVSSLPAISGTVTVGNSVNINSLPAISGTVIVGSALPTGTNRIGVVTIGGGTVTIGAGTSQIGSVTISSLPAISGTVTASNISISSLSDAGGNPVIRSFVFGYDYDEDLPVAIATNGGNALAVGVSGAVAASLNSAIPAGTNSIGTVTIGAGTVTIGAGTAQIGSVTASISGTVPISISSVTVGNSVTIGSLPAISGTVTANSSNGSLTTRFGSVTTANTAFATSAVTNANRKYLLIQNITTASNVITVGIGFTPTTTQGILLSSGAGITFDGNYIPTGAVNLLSSVTASCFTILEA